ncbi:pyrroline-5-carboxylate reductase [Zopfia rhizophila CBS 207.26]|uniref:Pyrroline-5-carboxylate reductase n=1 Tax=Zopfia rhizophila CBS 207.26 TaxID=1314779 RepID=A0A6A6DFQ0_9PEZI|nr:pyrroline-5-carboxylate reductase [Zopfia rhizophila CBS 207.26]
MTLAVIGCGNLGTAVLAGLMASQQNPQNQLSGTGQCGLRPIIRSVACVQSPARGQQIAEQFGENVGGSACPVEIAVADNAEGVRRADVIILACPPNQVNEVLAAPGMREALAGKLLISMLGGVSVAAMESAMYANSEREVPGLEPCHILRAISNIAAARKKSLTIIGERSASMPNATLNLGKDVLGQIGDIIEVRTDQMPAATALCASGTAFFALFLEAAIDGAVALGIDRSEAVHMAAHTMAGAAELTLFGDDPAEIRAKVTTPGGSTARGLGVMEEGGVKEAIVRALQATASVHKS